MESVSEATKKRGPYRKSQYLEEIEEPRSTLRNKRKRLEGLHAADTSYSNLEHSDTDDHLCDGERRPILDDVEANSALLVDHQVELGRPIIVT